MGHGYHKSIKEPAGTTLGFVTSVTNGIAVNIVVEKGLDQIIILKITYLYVHWLVETKVQGQASK